MDKRHQQAAGESLRSYLKRAARYCRRRYNQYRDTQHGGHWTHNMSDAMRDTERAFPDLGTFGVEGDCHLNGEDHVDCLYLNTGDTYADTLICGSSPRIMVGSWGDFMERHSR